MSTSYSTEFDYLFKLVNYRVSKSLDDAYNGTEPAMPATTTWNTNLAEFIGENGLDNNASVLLLIALAPYMHPHLFDDASGDLLEKSNFPRIGGTKGRNFRGFLPTGETAVYLISGENAQLRSTVQQLFQADHLFADKKVLWLETMPEGEPPLHGRIIMSQDYIDKLTSGKHATPHFSMSFPAKRVSTNLSWNDLVISRELREQIGELENWLTFNDQLVNDWGMGDRLKKGYRALFYGPSGTGKTFTAGLLGKEVGKEVYKIDLSMVVSKYIGETEKNLELLFARAEDKGWILFFDEADALFGKRTSVKEAHDKYANQEVSYLLQRIEDYNGMVILATNMKNNIDEAFIRRFNSVLRFSLPDETQRTEIWKLSFPRNVRFLDKYLPLEVSNELTGGKRQEINIPEQIKRYQLTGGNIINIVHYAGIKALEKFEMDKAAAAKASQKKKLQPVADQEGANQPFDLDEDTNEAPRMTIYLSDVLEGIKKELLKEGKPFA